MDNSIYKNIKIIWGHIEKKRRLHFKLLLILMIFVSFAEILSIGAVFPFFKVLTDPKKILDYSAINFFLEKLGITSASQIVLAVTIIFCFTILFVAVMRILLTWTSVRLSFDLGRDLSEDIYRRTLYQPYAVHVSRNSSDIINGIWIKVSEVLFYILMPGFTLISATVLCVALLITLCVIIPNIALVSIGILIVVYAIIIKLTKEKLKTNSVTIARESTTIIKNLQEGLSGIRDVLIDGSQERFVEIYSKTNFILRRSQGNNQIISQIPAFLLISLGMILIAFLSYSLTLSGGFLAALPSIIALTLGLQRLLPNAQQLYSSWSLIAGSQASLKDVIELLKQPYPKNLNNLENQTLPFEKDIVLHNISFSYDDKTAVLNNINLKINKGSRIGFIGPTGCGKSTLIDIVMGLLDPTAGELIVDDCKIDDSNRILWQKHIAHVPQTVFLSDNTIENNIAFGIPTELIDKERVRQAAKKAQLSEIIETWPQKYETRVGERGVQLSGGQCQRIGIARALYKQADIIVLDEATSALDEGTEKDVISAIEALSDEITILVIAHRLNTLSFCTEIIELGNGRIVKSIVD
jgi:ATP-binding cassette subfamily B protein